jgi:WhiB family redox-sensing transcriptional regulator
VSAWEDNWRHRAACRDEVDLFNTTFEQSYPAGVEDAAATTAARKVCAVCTVATDCLMWALTPPAAEFGMWAGLTPPERESLAPMVRRVRFDTHLSGADSAPVHGKMVAS